MVGTAIGKAVISAMPVGGIEYYLDAALTRKASARPETPQPEYDFGRFPYVAPGSSGQCLSEKSVHIWARNEGNGNRHISVDTDNAKVKVSAPNGQKLTVGQVIDWDMRAAFQGEFPTSDTAIEFGLIFG